MRIHLCREGGEICEVEVGGDEDDVLVEAVLDEPGDSPIEVVPVHEQRPLQEPEATEGVVAAQRRLATLLPEDPCDKNAERNGFHIGDAQSFC